MDLTNGVVPQLAPPKLQIIEGKDVDVIEPFPQKLLPQAAQWMRCQKTLIFGDDGPQTNEQITQFLITRAALPFIRTWGIVDKFNLTHTAASDVPLVGIVFFEQMNPQNGYFHVASNRRAWGDKLAQPSLTEQAGQLIIRECFESVPSLRRLSVATFATNRAAKHLAQRLGFAKDGYFSAMGAIHNKPVDVIHFGMLRPEQEQ